MYTYLSHTYIRIYVNTTSEMSCTCVHTYVRICKYDVDMYIPCVYRYVHMYSVSMCVYTYVHMAYTYHTSISFYTSIF